MQEHFYCNGCQAEFKLLIGKKERVSQAIEKIHNKHRSVSPLCETTDQIRCTTMETTNDDGSTREHFGRSLQKQPNPGDLIKVYKGTDGISGFYFAYHRRVEIIQGREVCVCTRAADKNPEFVSIKFFFPECRVYIPQK